jgi:hypothetical protein
MTAFAKTFCDDRTQTSSWAASIVCRNTNRALGREKITNFSGNIGESLRDTVGEGSTFAVIITVFSDEVWIMIGEI